MIAVSNCCITGIFPANEFIRYWIVNSNRVSMKWKNPGTSFAKISAKSAPVNHSRKTFASSGFFAAELRPIPISV